MYGEISRPIPRVTLEYNLRTELELLQLENAELRTKLEAKDDVWKRTLEAFKDE